MDRQSEDHSPGSDRSSAARGLVDVCTRTGGRRILDTDCGTVQGNCRACIRACIFLVGTVLVGTVLAGTVLVCTVLACTAQDGTVLVYKCFVRAYKCCFRVYKCSARACKLVVRFCIDGFDIVSVVFGSGFWGVNGAL